MEIDLATAEAPAEEVRSQVQATKIAYRLRMKSLVAIEVSSKKVNC